MNIADIELKLKESGLKYPKITQISACRDPLHSTWDQTVIRCQFSGVALVDGFVHFTFNGTFFINQEPE